MKFTLPVSGWFGKDLENEVFINEKGEIVFKRKDDDIMLTDVIIMPAEEWQSVKKFIDTLLK